MTKTGGKKICWTVPSVLHTTDKTLSSCSILQTFGRQGHGMVLGSIPTGCKTYSESCRAAAWDYLLILYKLSKYCRSCGCYLKMRILCVFPPTHSYFRGNNGDKNWRSKICWTVPSIQGWEFALWFFVRISGFLTKRANCSFVKEH